MNRKTTAYTRSRAQGTTRPLSDGITMSKEIKLPPLVPGTREQNDLWDHVYEYTHTSEGVHERLEKVCKAYTIQAIEADRAERRGEAVAQNTALIRQLVEALTTLRATGAHEGFAHDIATRAIAAGRAAGADGEPMTPRIRGKGNEMTQDTNTASGAAEPDNVTRLPDGSAFAIASFPLPDSHWLYAPREYAEGADVPKELPCPILSHTEHREAVVAAIRYAVRGATMCGKEPDFDPDALVQNAVYALCGPFGGRTTLAEKIALASAPAQAAEPANGTAYAELADKLAFGSVACGSDGEWVSIRRHVRDEAVTALRASRGQAPAGAVELSEQQILDTAQATPAYKDSTPELHIGAGGVSALMGGGKCGG